MPALPQEGVSRPIAAAVLTLLWVLGGLGAGAARARDRQDLQPASEAPALPVADAVRMQEFYRLLAAAGDEIFPGFADSPAPMLLVTAEHEFLVDWPKPLPEGFEALGLDRRLARPVASRSRQFSPGMEASFPAFGPPAVIVFGTAEATGRNSTEWVLTLLHEHLHQIQYAEPSYYADVQALDLAGSDTSGMWMLDYPFPYAEVGVGRAFSELAAALYAALEGEDQPSAAWKALDRLLGELEPADARYLSFQLWQEGVGRYVELRGAEVAAAGFDSSEAFAALGDFVDWKSAARQLRERLVRRLAEADLAGERRTAFYPVGAALAVLLDREQPGWKSRYFEEKFALDRYARVNR